MLNRKTKLYRVPTSHWPFSKHFITMAIQKLLQIIWPNQQVLVLKAQKGSLLLLATELYNIVPCPPCGCDLPQGYNPHRFSEVQWRQSQSLAALLSADHHDQRRSQPRKSWGFPLTCYILTAPACVFVKYEHIAHKKSKTNNSHEICNAKSPLHCIRYVRAPHHPLMLPVDLLTHP